MNKKLISILAVGMIAALAVFAGEIVDWSAEGGTAKIDVSASTATLTVDAATITTLTPTTANATDVNVAGALTTDATATSLTNGATLTMAKSVYNITGIGGADDTTNAITLGNVSAAMVGAHVTLVVNASSTNLISVADSGNPKLSAAWVGDNNDTLSLYIVDTNVFVQTSVSNN